MIKPDELESESGNVVWETIVASCDGNVAALRRLLQGDAGLSRAQFWYTPAVHFAVREGHPEAVQLLLETGADPEWNGLHDGSLVEMARERGHAGIARLLEQERDRRGRVITQPADHPIHALAETGDVGGVGAQLDADASLVDRGDRCGRTPLHRAVLGGAPGTVTFLLDRGADLHAIRGGARGLAGGFGTDLQAIDMAVWGNGHQRGAADIARLLMARGAAYDLTVAAALGDAERARQILDAEPDRIRETRPSGRRPLSAAVQGGHDHVARLLLERGADPNWDEPAAPKGASLQAAASAGNLAMVELLLAHGADPNSEVDSAAKPVLAGTPEIRALLLAHGATIEPYDLIWSDQDDEVMRRVSEDPRAAGRGGTAFWIVCGLGKRDLLARLLQAGLRVPSVLTVCQGYLLRHADMLRTLLAHGMSADVMNWQHQTLLHLVSAGEDIERAAMLLDAGAAISARDDEYRSTPLGWAARKNALQMVEFLLARGAPVNLPDDEPWATPLAWAERRQHVGIASILRRHGADQ